MTIRRLRQRTTHAQQMAGLLAAQRSVSADLPLAAKVADTVRIACDCLGAEYGALTVLAADGSIEHMAQHGRASDVVRSHLAVPVRVRGAAYGHLYLADAVPGRFDELAADFAAALAAAAGTAIDNARLQDDARRTRGWLDASGAAAHAALADADTHAVLETVSRALELTEADYAALLLPTTDRQLRVAVTKGVGADRFLGVVFDPRSSALGRAITSGSTGRTHDLLTWAEPGFGARFDFGPALLAPLTAMDGQPGAILLIRQAHRAAFTADDLQLASTFAAQLAVVLELGDVRGEIEWLRAVEQRHQAARELHDDVMQRLFATGVGLQVLAERQPDETAREQMLRYIDDLDETIEQIRARVFRLYPEDEPPPRHSDGYCQDATRAADGRTFRATGADPAPMRTLEPSDVRRTDQPEVNAQPSTPVVAVSGSDSARRKER